VLIARSESALLYFNVDHVRQRLIDLTQSRQEPIRLLILFLGAVPAIDLAGAEFLIGLRKQLAARGVELRLADAHGRVRDALRRAGFESDYGPLETGQTVESVLAAWQARAV
jgi:MFS superfamily sulfate permease-like transporter